jgi:hypothetical protein
LAIQQYGSYLPGAVSTEAQATGVAVPDATQSAQADAEGEIEADSALDNANFLSFEEWKKKNLARAGQSPENVGQGRAANSEERARRRPVNINALDALGEDSEIEIDFIGFGNVQGGDGDGASPSASGESSGVVNASDDEDKVAPTSFALSKDAGKTCKERFNYASFDCAATVLKTNPKAKSSSAILVENKDSYMLNECSAQNKFLIVELCDDILVDTVVLANYEFFSSMFRHFRVSVSDRYPVKLDRWRILATFESRNSRDIQPFLISEPQIWARYLRIEFLSHYGNEFYCPISLLRVHGTTMMEQFRREEEEARGDDDFIEPIEAVEGDPVETAAGMPEQGGTVPMEQETIKPTKDIDPVPNDPTDINNATEAVDPAEATGSAIPASGSRNSEDAEQVSDNAQSGGATAAGEMKSQAPVGSPTTTSVSQNQDSPAPSGASANSQNQKRSASTSASSSETSSSPTSKSSSPTNTPEQDNKTASASPIDDNSTVPSGSPSAKQAANSTAPNGSHSHSHAHRGSTQTQPSPSSPTTQESFFKSIHKRLQQLEANSTLSLQYIEEQSRILRDAFVKVEKRQMQKTEKFLDHLNSTVMQDLKRYRNMYEQLWQSVIIELEGMKDRQKVEIGEIGARLSLVADELVWQKKMAVVQSTLLLLCLGLVLFVRSGTLGSTQDGAPIAQQLGSKYSRFFDSPPRSPADPPGLVRRRRTFRNMWRSDTSIGLSERSGQLSDGGAQTGASDAETDGRRSPGLQVDFSPPTPDTPGTASDDASRGNSPSPAQSPGKGNDKSGGGPATPESISGGQARRIEALATQSGPATPRGSRDTRPSWEEVDRAVDKLRAGEQDEGTKGGEKRLGDGREDKRSPLRRAESYDASATAEDDGGDE